MHAYNLVHYAGHEKKKPPDARGAGDAVIEDRNRSGGQPVK
jgi:hypothetical protein